MNRWEKIQSVVRTRFGKEMDMDELLFVIGLQECGLPYRKFNKDEKIGIYHIAICSLLQPYGFYEFIGKDAEGWPHFELKKKLPNLSPTQQHHLMMDAVEEYFKRMGYLG